MIINDEHNYIFIHIPKTGGSSITEALGYKVGLQHLFNKVDSDIALFGTHTYARYVKDFMMKDNDGFVEYDSYFSFAIVRNPWDRLYSLYNFMCKAPRHESHIDQQQLIDKGFKHFLLDNREHGTLVAPAKNMNDIQHPSFYVHQQDTPQCHWIEDENGENIVSYVGKYEELDSVWEEIVVDTLEIDVQLPTINKHTEDDYREQYDDEMRTFVEETHKEDIIKFGYTFDGES